LIFNLTGEDLGPAERVDAQPDAAYPTVLAGTTLTFDGVRAAILSISQNSLQAVAPFSLEGKQSTELCIRTAADQTLDCITVTVQSRHRCAVCNTNRSRDGIESGRQRQLSRSSGSGGLGRSHSS
jgi:uncharacterized protein (TIGR03437 family)